MLLESDARREIGCLTMLPDEPLREAAAAAAAALWKGWMKYGGQKVLMIRATWVFFGCSVLINAQLMLHELTSHIWELPDIMSASAGWEGGHGKAEVA